MLQCTLQAQRGAVPRLVFEQIPRDSWGSRALFFLGFVPVESRAPRSLELRRVCHIALPQPFFEKPFTRYRKFCSRIASSMERAEQSSTQEKRRHVLITGVASKSGIGQSLVKAFCAEGYRVFGTDIRPLEPSKGLVEQLAQLDPPAKDQKGWGPDQFHKAFTFQQADISKPEEVKGMVEAAAQFLDGRIHVVVNNAGRSDPFIPESSNAIQEFASFINTNLVSAFNVTARALEHMPVGQSSVIHISSTRALQSEPHSEGYAAAKAGMLGLTHAQAISLADHGCHTYQRVADVSSTVSGQRSLTTSVQNSSVTGRVRVNAVLPGWIDTSPREDLSIPSADLTKEDHEWQPVGRVGLPEDIAHMCIFLSDESKAGYITGQHFVVDGGVTKKMVYPE